MIHRQSAILFVFPKCLLPAGWAAFYAPACISISLAVFHELPKSESTGKK